MKVICISGKAQHGKDTFAGMVKEELEHDGIKKVLIVHYGDMLKWVCRQFFDWDGEKDEHGRWLLQYVGTNVVRDNDPDFWADTLTRLLDSLKGFSGWDYVLIPDCRFPNEVEACIKRAFDVTHVMVVMHNFDNGLTPEQKNHPSETSMDDSTPDYYIYNDGTLDDLRESVCTFLTDLNGYHQLHMAEL